MPVEVQSFFNGFNFDTLLALITMKSNAARIHMNVYLWKDEIKGHDTVMEIEYKPAEFNMDYDIVNNPDKFELYVDGELVKYSDKEQTHIENDKAVTVMLLPLSFLRKRKIAFRMNA